MFTHKKERGWLVQGILAKWASNGETGGPAPDPHTRCAMRATAAVETAAMPAPEAAGAGAAAGAGRANLTAAAPRLMASRAGPSPRSPALGESAEDEDERDIVFMSRSSKRR